MTVAAAADLRFALDEIAAAFKKAHAHISVKATYGSSGNLCTQLSSGAPFDLFLSADTDYPRQLIEKGFAVKGTEFAYGVGRLALWVPAGSKLDVASRGMAVLADPSVRKIAIANPAHAPYGRAAVAAMKKLGVYDRVHDRLVLGENVSQAAQFVESGAADAAIIAYSLTLTPPMRDKGRTWDVPVDAYPRLEQGGVILTRAKDNAAAARLREFIIGPEGRTILQRYGFSPPGA